MYTPTGNGGYVQSGELRPHLQESELRFRSNSKPDFIQSNPETHDPVKNNTPFEQYSSYCDPVISLVEQQQQQRSVNNSILIHSHSHESDGSIESTATHAPDSSSFYNENLLICTSHEARQNIFSTGQSCMDNVLESQRVKIDLERSRNDAVNTCNSCRLVLFDIANLDRAGSNIGTSFVPDCTNTSLCDKPNTECYTCTTCSKQSNKNSNNKFGNVEFNRRSEQSDDDCLDEGESLISASESENRLSDDQATLDMEYDDLQEDDRLLIPREERLREEIRQKQLSRKNRSRVKVVIAVLGAVLILAIIIAVPLVLTLNRSKSKQPLEAERGFVVPVSQSNLGTYQNAAVATDAPQCSHIGKQILEEKNGSAVDAAIASLLCVGAASMMSTGIGGGFFMVVYERSTQKTVIIDAREVAPQEATADMFYDEPIKSLRGGLAIGVPGEIRGYAEAYQRFGKLPWADLFEPIIAMLEDGFPVPPILAKHIEEEKAWIQLYPDLNKVLTNSETGDYYKANEIMTHPLLAKTMRTIAEKGAEEFYSGELSKTILSEIQQAGGRFTAQDLPDYKARIREPSTITLANGLRVVGPPSPGSGPVIEFILNILDGYNLTPDNLKETESSVLTYHRIVETFKFAYAKRPGLGDEDFVNVTELVANLTSKSYADFIRSQIQDSKTANDINYYGPLFKQPKSEGTSHISIVAENGDAVSVTATINTEFASGVLGSSTGILYNNEMDDFSTPNTTNYFGIAPSDTNYVEPGKRPFSSMSPTIIIDSEGDVRLVTGASGGSLITTATAYVAAHVMWLGMDVKTATDNLRLHHQLIPPYLQYETGFYPEILSGLKEKGHNVTEFSLGKVVVQSIVRDGNTLYANSDFRKGGVADGY